MNPTELVTFPLAGDYDGQLLRNVIDLPVAYWSEHPEQRGKVLAICTYALREAREEEDGDLILTIKNWMSHQLQEIEGHNRRESEQ